MGQVVICLPVQETQVQSLVWEDSTCCGAAKPEHRSHWTCAREPGSHSYWSACARDPALCNKGGRCKEEHRHWTQEQPSFTATGEKPAQQQRLSTATKKKRKEKRKELRKDWQMDEPLGSSRDYARRTPGTNQCGTVGRTLWVRGPALLPTVCVTSMKLLPFSGLISLAINERQDHFNSMSLL